MIRTVIKSNMGVGNMYSIVIVDDEHMIKQSLRKLIEKAEHGFQVVADAKNGIEALEHVAMYAPDLLFIDIKMPVMDGLELLEQLALREGDREVVIISGYDDFRYAQKALRFGVTDYILKPIEPEQVIAALHRVAARLAAKEMDMVRDSSWVQYCRTHGTVIAELLWLLEDARLLDKLALIDRQFREQGVSSRLMKQLYMNLTALVFLELRDKNVEGLDALSVRVKEAGTEHVFSIMKDVMTEAAGIIRRSRNFGHRKSIEYVVHYIERTYRQETLSLSEVADQIGISVSHLSLLFKEDMGIGFIQYVTKKRMEQAMLLLQDPLSKATEIAHQVGYGDYSHFNKAFKKYCGVSPQEYKKRFGVY